MKKLLSLTLLICNLLLFAQDGPSMLTNNEPELRSDQGASFNFANQVDEIWMNNIYNSPLYKSALLPGENNELTSEILKERLISLNHKTPFPVEYNATIERFIRLYLNTRKEDLSNLMDKASYYFPIFEEHLDKYNLPLEIKYLAVVESALKPKARSKVGAKGIWQFMYHTGRQFGLEVTSYVDERSDPIKATEAACKYLESLHDTFGDWDLALAAYNSGPGNVSKAIRRSGGLRNYWNIRKYLPAETRNYVPAFYTTYYLFEYGELHGIYPKNMNITFFETDTIHVKKRLTFSKIEQEIGIDKKLLARLNPQYKVNIIPYREGRNYALTLPKSFMDQFISKEQKIYGLPKNEKITREEPTYITPNKTNSYVVQEGDNLPRIAKKFQISLPELKEWNGLQTNYLIKGQSLVVSSNNQLPHKNRPLNKLTLNKKATFRKNQVTNEQQINIYTVKEGESLFMISKQFSNVSINQIRHWNNIWNVSYVAPGTQLKILTKNK